MYPTDLIGMGKQVYEDLNTVFDFDIDVSGYALDLREPVAQDILRQYSRLHGASEQESESSANRYISGKTPATCAYTGHIPEFRLDYLIFVSSVSEVTPIYLGEEIVHGEHHGYHEKKFGDFQQNFSEPSIEFLGFLGLRHIQSQFHNAATRFIVSDKDSLIENEADVDHYVGYSIADQLIASGKVPYSDLFHARTESDMWKIVNGIFVPNIGMSLPSELVDRLRVYLHEYVDSVGLKTTIEIVES